MRPCIAAIAGYSDYPIFVTLRSFAIIFDSVDISHLLLQIRCQSKQEHVSPRRTIIFLVIASSSKGKSKYNHWKVIKIVKDDISGLIHIITIDWIVEKHP